MEREDRRRRVTSRVLAILAIVTGLIYVIWAILALNPAHPVLGTVFIGFEIVCLVLFVLATLGVWQLRFKPVQGLEIERAYSIDVFITTCGEPLPVIRRTLLHASQIRWRGRLQVYVLDDGGSEEVESVATSLNFVYLSRKKQQLSLADGKSGNLNFGFQNSHGEMILVLDADQLAQPEILEAMAGYMRFAKVAFVQSKQSFLVPEQDPFFNSDPVFYNAVQLGFDSDDSVISCGSGVLYRRAALEGIGGFATWNLVEDLTTSLELHSRGWKSFYYPHALSVGLAPSDIWGVCQQRGQWALDTMRLFIWDNPVFKRGLSWRRRKGYLVICMSYLTAAVVFPFFFSIPIWSYVTGNSIFSRYELEFVAFRSVYFVAMAMAMHFLFRRQEPGRQFQMLTGLFPVYLAGAIRALRYPPGRKPAYRANNQQRSIHQRGRMWMVLPQLILLLSNLTLPFVAALIGSAPIRLIAANALVSAIAFWSLYPIVFATFVPKTWGRGTNPEHVYGVDPKNS